MPRLGDILAAARVRLADAGVATPEMDARLLVGEALGLSPVVLATEPGKHVETHEAVQCEVLVDRRAGGEPVDRILGRREFWGLTFRLAPATLSPRPDTETLVEAALAAVPDARKALRVLDLGTGSGALLVALLHEWPNATGIGIDRSPEALAIAKENAEAAGVGARASFLAGNWAVGIDERFDVVVSNPPYIESAAIPTLDREVRLHDPLLALDGGPDGLDAYRAIAEALPRLLKPEGVAILEIGQGQAQIVADLLQRQGLSLDGTARTDLAGMPRALVARRLTGG